MLERAIHFIGFRGEEYWSAVKVWGKPDFYHIGWDMRAKRDIAPEDIIVSPRELGEPSQYSYPDIKE